MALGPHSSRKNCTAIARGVVALCAVLLSVSTSQADGVAETLRLRIAWGGGTPTQWIGRISLSEGTLSQIQLTSTETDAPGSIWIESGAVQIAAPRPRRVDGFDVTATAPLTAMLRVELTGDPAVAPHVVEIPLEKLWREYQRLPLDDRGNAVLVHRAVGDSLRIITDREDLLFRPAEQFAFDLVMAIPDMEPGSSLDLTVELLSARGSQSMWSEPQRVPVPVDRLPRLSLNVPLPGEEGVYTIRIAAAKAAGFHERWVPGVAPKPLAERRFQVVVFDPQKAPAEATDAWRTLLEIDPAHPAWWERLPDWVWLPAARFMPKGPLGSAPAKVVEHPLGKFVELPPHARDESAPWHAYPLPIGRPGLPHLIEVDYPADQPQELGVSLVEPNAAGRVLPPGQHGGSLVDEWSTSSEAGIRRVQYLCWPRTASPMLVIRNPSTKNAARFGNIRVLAAGNQLPPVANVADGESRQRLVAAYIARPYLAESLGASDGASASGQAVHDWQSYYEATTRLPDYLRYAGYNAAVINVAAEGSAIYPSQLLQRTPRYDRSWLDAGAVDLPPIDPLELLLRVADRAGLAIVPALRFDAPLPQLEALRRSDRALDAALVCRDARGRSWHDWFAASNPAAVRYNLLHPRVQEALGAAAQEVVDRYGNHSSFAGLGIQLAGGTSATLPSPRWTSDAETLQAYLAETGATWPVGYDAADPVARFRGLSEQDAPFRAWRAASAGRFYSSLAQQLADGHSSRRLVLLSEELFDDPELTLRTRSRLNASVAWSELLVEAGIDWKQYAADERISLLRPVYMADGRQLPDAAHDLHINTADELNQLSRRGAFGGLVQFQRPAAERLTSFEAASPFGADRTNLTITTPPLPDVMVARRQLASGLASGNPEIVLVGGSTLPRGGEEHQRQLLQLLALLPAESAASEMRTEHGVCVRLHQAANDTTCVLVNESPWTVETAVTLDFPTRGRMTPLPSAAGAPAGELYSPGQHVWSVTLPPFDAIAVRCDVPRLTVVGIRSRVAPSAQTRLATQLQDLRARNLNDQRTYPVLKNASFEPSITAATGIDGWLVQPPEASGQCTLDKTAPQAGESSLHIQSTGVAAGVVSLPFANPGTGQLAMTAYVRARGVQPNTELRIFFEANRHGYRQFTAISGQQLLTGAEEFTWRYLAFGVDDLPLDLRSQVQVRFELSGPGDVWIDQVTLYDLLFPHNFYAESSKQKLALVRRITAVESALAEDRLFDCWRQMDDYWMRYVRQHLPLVATPSGVVAGATTSSQAEAPKPREEPSLGERIKQYVPGFLR